jgi:glutamine amidotransferase
VLRALDRSVTTQKEIRATADPDEVRRADVVVVPGQGSFGAFASALDAGLRDVIREKIRSGTPYLGICLGLQILFAESDEAPGAAGLGVLGGRVRRLTPGSTQGLSPLDPVLPHMGWNRAEAAKASEVFEPAHYYFAHTYAAAPVDPQVTLATTTYGADTFASAVESGPIVGVQFHPEKSQRAGLALLERFFARRL